MESYLYFCVQLTKDEFKNKINLNLKDQLVRAGVGCSGRKYGEILKAIVYSELDKPTKSSTLLNLQNLIYKESPNLLLLITQSISIKTTMIHCTKKRSYFQETAHLRSPL